MAENLYNYNMNKQTLDLGFYCNTCCGCVLSFFTSLLDLLQLELAELIRREKGEIIKGARDPDPLSVLFQYRVLDFIINRAPQRARYPERRSRATTDEHMTMTYDMGGDTKTRTQNTASDPCSMLRPRISASPANSPKGWKR